MSDLLLFILFISFFSVKFPKSLREVRIAYTSLPFLFTYILYTYTDMIVSNRNGEPNNIIIHCIYFIIS